MVQIRTILGLLKEYPVDSVMFASSSDIEDHDHLINLEEEFGVKKSHTVTMNSIEEMWSLVKMAPHVYTDRYHPGVAAVIQGTPFTIISFPSEAIKLAGLYRMSTTYTVEEIEEMNKKAFDKLAQIIIDNQNSMPAVRSNAQY